MVDVDVERRDGIEEVGLDKGVDDLMGVIDLTDVLFESSTMTVVKLERISSSLFTSMSSP